MANPIPSSLALTTINDGAQIIASDHRNNYSAISSAVNLLRAALAGGTAGQFLQAADSNDVQWVTVQKYRKTTAKQVVNTITETDLLNGEITVGAGVLGTNNTIRFTASGDLINNSGGTVGTPRFKLKLGATTLLDTGTIAAVWATNGARWGWKFTVEITNLGAANSQWVSLVADLTANTTAGGVSTFTTGEGEYAAYVPGSQWRAVGNSSGAVDTTVSQVLALTVINPSANAAIDVTLKNALVVVE